MSPFRAVIITVCILLQAYATLSAGSLSASSGSASPGSSGEVNDVDPSGRYILIHLDSASSHYIQSELEAGNLPNIEQTFRDHGFIEEALTYFPSKTPTVISSLRDGISIEESTLVSWAGSDRDTGEVFSGPNTFMQMVLSKPRIAASNLLYGIPAVDWLGGLALSNLPDLLDDYRVLEFYWYAVDTYGHFYGEERYLQKLRNFDTQFGRMVRRLDEDVNIIIYADHGMTFGEGVNTHKEIEEAVGDQIYTVSYPNVYANDLADHEELAARILAETSIEFAFFRNGDSTVTGLHKNGIMHFHGENQGIRYSYEIDDPLGYYERGYNGEPLTANQWLEFTHDMVYPATPVQIYRLMSNPGSGDILTLLDETRYSRTAYSRRGNHGGFTYMDVTIPILLRGPDLEFLYDRETLWLQDLFHEIQGVPFGNTPTRDEHYADGWYDFHSNQSTFRLSFSPWYRWRIGTEATFPDANNLTGTLDPDRFQAWGKFDLYRSYLARFWAGAGADIRNGDVRPMAFIRHEMRYRQLTARTTLSTAGNHTFVLEYRLARPFSLQVVNFNSAGIRFHF